MERHIPWNLLISHLKNETNPDEERTLSEWRSLNDNETLYEEIITVWKEIIKDTTTYNPDTEYYWKQMEICMEKNKRILSFSLHKIRISITAASILLFIAVFSSYFITKNYFQPEISKQTYKALNGKSEISLPDGSVVWLNIGSSLTYQTTFLNNRQVTLDGEALFEVQKDTKHPFVVSAGDIRVKVLGTRFNVDAYPTKEIIRIALLNGEVAVYTPEQNMEMVAGDVVAYDRKTTVLSKITEDIVFETFWANKSYSFKAESLSHICKYLERWYNIRIEIDPDIAESQIYTFTVSDEPLETILQIMSHINPIQYSFEENKRVIIKNVSPTNK